VIVDVKRLESDVLPLFYNTSRVNSFLRQLSFYGFSKETLNEKSLYHGRWMFTHDRFRRDRPDLQATIKRKTYGTSIAAKDEEILALQQQVIKLTAQVEHLQSVVRSGGGVDVESSISQGASGFTMSPPPRRRKRRRTGDYFEQAPNTQDFNLPFDDIDSSAFNEGLDESLMDIDLADFLDDVELNGDIGVTTPVPSLSEVADDDAGASVNSDAAKDVIKALTPDMKETIVEQAVGAVMAKAIAPAFFSAMMSTLVPVMAEPMSITTDA